MGCYSHRRWQCPYFKWDEKATIHCEAGVIRFPDRRACTQYETAFCASKDGWQYCSLSDALSEYYDRQDKPKGGTN